MGKKLSHIIILLITLAFQSCFTGVESTKEITQDDVDRVIPRGEDNENQVIEIKTDTFPKWEKGKCFYVTDNNIKYIFSPSPQYLTDTLQLSGKILTYDSYYLSTAVDNRAVININFQCDGNTFTYPTNKTMYDIESSRNYRLEVPFLVDMDEVERFKEKLNGMELYVKTPIWYNRNGEMTEGRKYIKVKITNVFPGNKVYPYLVEFNDNFKTAYLFMSYRDDYLHRGFNDLFSYTNPKDQYPLISDETWQLIINGQIARYMTKVECRLSIGAPDQIERMPTYSGVREYWYYITGTYLIFDEEGLLSKFRK